MWFPKYISFGFLSVLEEIGLLNQAFQEKVKLEWCSEQRPFRKQASIILTFSNHFSSMVFLSMEVRGENTVFLNQVHPWQELFIHL